MSFSPKKWPVLDQYNINILVAKSSEGDNMAVFQSTSPKGFSEKIAKSFDARNFAKKSMGSEMVYTKIGSLRGDELKAIFPDFSVRTISNEADLASITVQTTLTDYIEPKAEVAPAPAAAVEVDKPAKPEAKKKPAAKAKKEEVPAVDEKDVSWLVDEAMSSDEAAPEQAPVVDEPVVAKAPEEAPEQAPEVQDSEPVEDVKATEEVDTGVTGERTEFEAYMIQQGVPRNVRDEFLKAEKEINATVDPEVINADPLLAPAAFRKIFKTKTKRADLAKMKIADRVYPFMHAFNELSADEVAACVEFANDHEQDVEDFHEFFRDLSEKMERETNKANIMSTFETDVRIAGTVNMVNFITADDQKEFEDSIKSDKRFALLSGSQYTNYKSPTLTMMRKDEDLRTQIKDEWDQKFGSTGPSMKM